MQSPNWNVSIAADVTTPDFMTKIPVHCDFNVSGAAHTDTHQHIPPTQTSEHDVLQVHLRLRQLLDRDMCFFMKIILPPTSTTVQYTCLHMHNVWSIALFLDVMRLPAGLITQRETREMLYLFNRCHISSKRLETDIQEGILFHS